MDKIKESEEAHFDRLERQLEKDPKNAPSLIEKGVLLFEHFHLHDEAIGCLTKALKHDPTNVDALFWLAVCYFFDFLEYAEAKEALTKALELDPNRPDCLYRTSLKTCLSTEAKVLAVGAIATSFVLEIRATLRSSNPEALARSKGKFSVTFGISLMATVIWDSEKNIEKAMIFTKKALAQAPTWPNLYHKLATLLIEEGKVEEAEQVAKEGMKYASQCSEFANDIERYFEHVITGRASSCGQDGWNYLMNEIKEAKQKRIQP